jgi:hypothetical protein
MGSARPSVTKRQREQQKRERKLRKAEKRAERKTAPPGSESDTEDILVSESAEPVESAEDVG